METLNDVCNILSLLLFCGNSTPLFRVFSSRTLFFHAPPRFYKWSLYSGVPKKKKKKTISVLIELLLIFPLLQCRLYTYNTSHDGDRECSHSNTVLIRRRGHDTAVLHFVKRRGKKTAPFKMTLRDEAKIVTRQCVFLKKKKKTKLTLIRFRASTVDFKLTFVEKKNNNNSVIYTFQPRAPFKRVRV